MIVDATRNTLRLLVAGAAGAAGEAEATVSTAAGTLDVGEAGRLLGLEIDGVAGPAGWYLDLEDAPGSLLRSVPVRVSVGAAADGRPVWVDLPRRGEGYELSFPVGNACWVRPRRP